MPGQEVGSLYYDLNIDDKNLKTQLDNADNQVKGFGDRVNKYWGDSVDASKKFALAVGAIGAAVVTFGVSSVKAFSESQDLIAQTNAVLKSTAGIAGVTADQVTKLATSWQLQSKYSDEAVRGAENILLTFTNIGKNVFPDATKAVLDVSTAMHQDLQTSSIQIGKALQDPIHGMTALSRVGALNRDDFERLNKEWSGGTVPLLDQQRELLQALNKEFAGSAVAAGGTFAGSVAKLKNAFNDLQEQVGQVIVKALGPFADLLAKVTAHISDSGGILKMITTFWDEHKGMVIAAAGAIAGALVPAIVAMTVAFAGFLLTLAPWMLVGAGLAILWRDHSDKIKELASAVGDYLWPKIQALWQTINNDLIPALSNFWHNFLEPLVQLLGPIVGEGLVWAFGLVIGAAKDLVLALSGVINWITNNKPVVEGLAIAFAGLATAMAFNAVVNAFILAFNRIILITIPSLVASWGSLTALLTSPIVIPALIIGAAVASINTIRAAWDAVYNAAAAAANIGNDGQMKALQKQAAAARAMGDTAQVNRIANAIAALGGGREKGGPVLGGMPYMTGEAGRELFIPTQNGFILPNQLTNMLMKSMGGGKANGDTYVNIGEVNNAQDEDYVLRRLNRNSQLEGMGLSSVGGI